MGCAETTTQIRNVYIVPEIPKELLECPERPVVPEPASDRSVALWVLDLSEAHAECKDDLTTVGDILSDTRERTK